ncbi:hypothetical protein AB1Y20_003671 [Prymnesium parvum]|uniref:EF-hand domain-containing protein n=1 Tax=Prymnesium parvum TaxID=97485 RepID=A0AB34J8C0_PRYPA
MRSGESLDVLEQLATGNLTAELRELLAHRKVAVTQSKGGDSAGFQRVDGISRLSYKDFEEFFRHRLGRTSARDAFDATPERVKRLWFKCLDSNNDGLLSRGELFGFMLLQQSLSGGEYDLLKLLQAYPELRGSTISTDQLASVVQKNGFPRETVDEVMMQIGNGTGMLEFVELGQWVRMAKKGLKLASSAPTGGLTVLSNLLSRGRAEQTHQRKKQIAERIEAFSKVDRKHQEINQALGTVLTNKKDVLAAERLAGQLRDKFSEGAPIDNTKYKDYVLDVIVQWDLGKEERDKISLRELHQGIVLLGIENASAGAMQELFDEIDDAGAYSMPIARLAEFIISGSDSTQFSRRESNFLH